LVLNLFAPANSFQDRREPVVGRIVRQMRQTRGFCPLGETVSVVLSGVTLLQREALEARPGAASTVKVEAVVCTTLTARSEPYNRKAIHASRLNQARMRNEIEIPKNDVAARNHGSQRRHRGRRRIATGKANVFGFCSGAPPFVPERKTRSLWLPAQIVAEPTIRRF
jgi:hypothetical protein